MTEKYMTPEEASVYLREHWGLSIQPSGLARKRTSGDGPAYTRNGRSPKYSAASLDDYARNRSMFLNTAQELKGT